MSRNITVIIEREAIPGKVNEFHEALKNIQDVACKQDGFVEHQTDISDDRTKVRVHVCFKDAESIQKWESSEEKKVLLEELNKYSITHKKFFATSGLETWFVNYNGQIKSPPPKHKMAVISWIAVTPLLLVVNILMKPILEGLPVPIRIVCVTPIVAVLMTYVAMPFMAKLFSKWLYPE